MQAKGTIKLSDHVSEKENKNHILHHIHAYERFGDSVVGKNVEGIKVGLSLVIASVGVSV